jgi:hypothetical protein
MNKKEKKEIVGQCECCNNVDYLKYKGLKGERICTNCFIWLQNIKKQEAKNV